MNYKFAIIGGDKRNIFLSKFLKDLGHDVKIYGFDKSGLENKTTLKETINFADYIICPIPFTRDDVFLNTPLSSQKIEINELLENTNNKKPIFTGVFNKNLANLDMLVDIYNTEALTTASAISTTEGAIKIAIENTDFSLYNSQALVIGYGKIGSYLAQTLKSLGVNITVVTKDELSISNAIDNGFKTYKNTEIDTTLSNKNIIFNTAPAIQIDSSNIKNIDSDCLYIELASKPFGIDYEESVKNNIKVIYGMSLPGLVSPKTIANTLCNEILEKIKEMNK